MKRYTTAKSLNPKISEGVRNGDIMSANRFCVMILVIFMSVTAILGASPAEHLTTHKLVDADKIVQSDSVSVNKIEDAWARFDRSGYYEKVVKTKAIKATDFPGILQANATIEITSAGNNAYVIFQQLTESLPGSYFTSRAVLPNGSPVPMDAYTVNGNWRIYSELWNGPFPSAWQTGFTRFEGLLIDPSGGLSYVSASVLVRGCCATPGLLHGVKFINHNEIDFTGFYTGIPVVTVNGEQMPMSGSYNVGTGVLTGRIFGQFYQDEVLVTVSGNGVSSTRHIYPNDDPMTGTVTPTTPPQIVICGDPRAINFNLPGLCVYPTKP